MLSHAGVFVSHAIDVLPDPSFMLMCHAHRIVLKATADIAVESVDYCHGKQAAYVTAQGAATAMDVHKARKNLLMMKPKVITGQVVKGTAASAAQVAVAEDGPKEASNDTFRVTRARGTRSWSVKLEPATPPAAEGEGTASVIEQRPRAASAPAEPTEASLTSRMGSVIGDFAGSSAAWALNHAVVRLQKPLPGAKEKARRRRELMKEGI